MTTSATGTQPCVSKAFGWTLIVLFVVMVGTHPGALVGLVDRFLAVLDRAGSEFSSFLNDL
jgi:hypothetical protein